MHRDGFIELERQIRLLAQRTAPAPEISGNSIQSTAFAPQSRAGTDRRSRAAETIRLLQLLLEESPDMQLRLHEVAYLLHLEKTYCSRVFRNLCGKSLTEWIRAIRIGMATHLLRRTTFTITEVAHAVGYGDITTFERNFQKELHVSPKTFRRTYRGAEAGCRSV